MRLVTNCRLIGVITLAATIVANPASAQNTRNWQTGKLLEMEQTKVREGATKTTNTDGSAKKKSDDNTDYSQTTTTTTSDNYETYQIYTIQGNGKVYVAKEHLLFPWSKPANLEVGEQVEFSVQKNTMYILDSDKKQHKASITKISAKGD